MSEVKDSAVAVAQERAVVQDRSRSNALVGSIDERLRAFQQIAANLAGLKLNGWDTVQKCLAACWLADGAGMHPAIFVQNHYCMEMQGKLLVEPKWEFIVGMLQSRVLGFKFEVLEETDDKSTVKMSDSSGNTQQVTYTLADAKRQGLLSRGGNMWTAGNTREGCFKQAVKRCGRRLAPAALMDLPIWLDGMEMEAEAQPPAVSAAKAIGAAVSKVESQAAPKAPAEAEEVPYQEIPADGSPQAEDSPRMRLDALMTERYGRLSKPVKAQKLSLIYNEMMKKLTGVDPKRVFKAGELGPVEAEQIIAYLTKGEVGEPTDAEDGAPPTEAEPAPEPEQEEAPDPNERTAEIAYSEFMVTVNRARKVFAPRKFIAEHEPDSGKFWFTDQATILQVGDTKSILLQMAGDVVAPVSKIDSLNKVLGEMCDQKERGGR